ncbi:MAG: CAP domain-containing protein [Deltaproteobacteria bacterium]|nr:MAG: CAP domain-containing protein [Deltaproteobacteria bacterium]
MRVSSASVALALVCVGAGCAPGPRARQAVARIVEVRAVRATVDPSVSDGYGHHAAFVAGPVEGAVLGRLEGAGLEHAPALSAALRDIGRFAPSRHRIPAALVEGVLARHGLPDPPPRLVVVELDGDPGTECKGAGTVCADLATSLEGAARSHAAGLSKPVVGVGAVPLSGRKGLRIVLGVLDRGVELEPFPRAVPVGASVQLRGRLAPGRHRPSLEIVDPSGRIHTRSVGVGAGGVFAADVVCPSRGIMRIEVLAVGAYGPEVVANAPVGCGRDLPASFTVEVEWLRPGTTPEEVARASAALVAEERRRRGLSALTWDEDVAAVARSHAAEMATRGYVGHVSPVTGDAASRVARAGISARTVRENVARGYGPREIHGSLLRSPGHRANLLADDVDRIGIGVAFGTREGDDPGAPRPIYVVQVFVRRPLDPGRAAPSVLARMLRERGLVRAPAAVEDPALSKLAADDAEHVAAGRSLDPARRTAALAAAGYGGASRIEAVAPAFEDLVEASLWNDVAGRYGIGVVRRGDGAYVLVVYVAR